VTEKEAIGSQSGNPQSFLSLTSLLRSFHVPNHATATVIWEWVRNLYVQDGIDEVDGSTRRKIMTTLPIVNVLVSNWWLLLVRGILAVVFGVMAIAWPGLTVLTLVLLYGIYALLDGLTAMWVGGSSRAWGLLLFGLLGVVVGLYTFVYPGITALALIYLIAGWAFVRGIFEIMTAIQLRKEISNEWVLILSGVISIIFGAVLVANPRAGALSMAMVIGVFALVYGLMMIILAFRVHGLPKRLERLAHT